jgi:tRNA G18 (ribose-2'-O)-methylase SpoU
MKKLRLEDIDRLSPEDLAEAPRHPVVVVVDNVRSVHNVGSIFRTADAARVAHLFLTGYTPTPEHKDMHRTALGAEATVPWSHHASALPVLDRLRTEGHTVAALEIADVSTPPDAVGADAFPLALVVGNEVHGVDDAIMEVADLALEIPQYGAKHSLNVSVAFGIAAFDLVRRARTLFDGPGFDGSVFDGPGGAPRPNG